MGILDDLLDTTPSEGGRYLPVGEGVCSINSLELGEKDNGEKFFAGDMVIEEIKTGCEGFVEGEHASYFRKFKYPEATKAEIHALLLAAFGTKLGRVIKAGELTKKEQDAAIGEKQILTGVKVRWVAFQKEGKQYTHYRWSPVL